MGENTKLGHTVRKMSKFDKAFMKVLLPLAAGAEDNEALLDKVLTEFTKLKSITLDATHEVATLQGILTSAQKKKTEKPTYSQKVTGQIQGKEPREEVVNFFDHEEREREMRHETNLIVTSGHLGKDEIRHIIKRKVDPHKLGVPEPEMRPGKEGVVIMATTGKGLQRLEDFIRKDEELRTKLKTRKPKSKTLEIKVIGIDEGLGNQEISTKIIEQNGLNSTGEGVQVIKTWKGKNGKTAIISLNLQAWQKTKGKTHLNIGWEKCPIFDNTFVPRCNNCAKYGHTQRWCQARSPRCTECGGQHHFKECKKEDYECCTCTGEGTDTDLANHSMMAMDCPTFLRRREQERRKIVNHLQLEEE